MLVVLCSAKGSPGVTTAGLALAASGGILVECDPAGGDIRCWSEAIRGQGAGLVELVAQLRAGEPDPDEILGACADEPWPGVRVVTGPPSPATAQNTLQVGEERLAAALATSSTPVLADAGRWTTVPGMAALARAASTVAVVLRPTVDGVEHAGHLIDGLHGTAARVCLLLVGDRPYGPAEVGAALGADVWGVLAMDAAGVACLVTDGTVAKRWPRSELARSASHLLSALALGAAPESHDGGWPRPSLHKS